MTDDELKELVASIAVAQKETEAQMAKTDAKLDKLAKMYGGVGNSQGAVAEEFYYNSLKDNPILHNMAFNAVYKNITGARQGVENEYDLLLVNGQEVFVIEVKYKAYEDDLVCLLEKKCPNFNVLFPQYADYQQYWGLATFHIHDELKQAALKQGITVLQRKGDVIETLAA